MKHYYQLTDNEPAIVSGQISKPEGFTEYDPDNPPEDLVLAQKSNALNTESHRKTTDIQIPSHLLLPFSLGGSAVDETLIKMLSTAVALGAKVVTHPEKGITCVTVYDTFLDTLPTPVKDLLDQFIVDKSVNNK